jgi:NAD-dependent dihydropyrimidine dehydrogenase PreA subunit
MKRKVIKIDEAICNGCGSCVKGCHEGALQLIDGKARIINEVFCDGLGACIGECPVGAIETEEREAVPYDETAVMKEITQKGEKTIIAHLLHLKEHGETEYYNQGINYLKENNINIDLSAHAGHECGGGCPGSMEMTFKRTETPATAENVSLLSQWPIQLHLLNPQSSFLKNADILLAADCTAYAYGNFHNRFLKNNSIAIACPKLDNSKDEYTEKLTAMIDLSNINTLTVVIMEVPCCEALVQIAQNAVSKANRKVPIKKIIIAIKGDLLKEEWV